MLGRRNEIDRAKLLFLSLFIFFLVFPYSYFGHLAFFPDIFSALFAYWICSDRTKSFGVILISGLIGIIKVSLGGSFVSSSFFVALGLISSFYPDFFQGNLPSVIMTTLLSSFFSVLFEANLLESFPIVILLILVKVFVTTIFSISIYPFVLIERRKAIL